MTTSVLAGLRVIDLGSGTAGASATMLLSDHGAEVIKVEPPGGDPFRAAPGSIVWNRGKTSIVLDLRIPMERERLLDLAQDADIFVETFSPGVTSRLGIGYDALSDINDRLIYCSITGYGRKGALRDRPGYDALVQARSGLQFEQPGLREGPIFLHAPLPSFGASLLAVAGISAALRAREITGRGQWVETSLMQGALLWTTQIWKRASRPTGPLFEMWQFKDLGPTPCFEAGDGEWFHAMPAAIPIALAHLGRDPKELDARFIVSGDRRSREQFFEAARDIFRQRKRDEWVELFQRRDIPCQPIQPAEDVFDHPQVVHNGAVLTLDIPGIGPVTQVGHTYRLERHAHSIQGPPPAIDQHADQIPPAPRAPQAAPEKSGGPRDDSLRHALDGVRVLDFGTVIAGPFGCMILADLGADVISIEPMSAAVGTPADATWAATARGKRCIAIDLKTSEGQEIARRLIATADVVHYNLRTGVAERLGFGYETVKEINPRAVFCHLTAYGNTGPLARWPGCDQTAQALCGLEYEQGASATGGHPTWCRFGMTDATSGMFSVIAILQALFRREQTGLGQEVTTDILSAGMFLASDAFVGPDVLPRRPHLDRHQTGLGPYYRLYKTSDDWICIAAVTDEQQQHLLAVSGASGPSAPEALAADLETWFAGRPSVACIEMLDAAGVPCEPVVEHTDAWYDDPDVIANGWVAQYEHPVWGRLEQPGTFLELSDTPGRINGAPPLIGEHTRLILDELGYSEREIELLHHRQVVGSPQ